MKHIFFFIFLNSLVLSVFGQISVQDWNGKDLSSGTHPLPIAADLESGYDFSITNNGSSDITYIIKVLSFTFSSDAYALAVCGNGNCVPITSAPTTIGSPTLLSAGDTFGEEGNLENEVADVAYVAGESTAVANITIKVYEEGNETNFAEFTLSTEYASVSELDLRDNISVYPNPAASYTDIKVSNHLIGGKIVLTNILGKTVLSQNIDKPETRLSTKEFSSGIYIYSFFKDGRKRSTKKIIVN